MTIATPEEIKRGIALYEQWRNENTMNEKVIKHKAICDQLNELYARKNHDYGDSFHQTFVEEGMAMPRIRLGDKFSRFKTLSSGQSQQVSDESIVDTLMDMANYAIMTILELTEGDYDILYADGKPYAALKGNGHVAT